MGTRWAGQGRSTRRAADALGVDERGRKGGPGGRPPRRRRRTGAVDAAAGDDVDASEATSAEIGEDVGLRRLAPSRLKARVHVRTKYKLALGTLFFGTFLIAGGLFIAYITASLASGDEQRVLTWGYVGGFVISLVSSATVVVPAPGAVLIIQMAQTLNPITLGIVTGIAGALGGITAYMAGAAGGKSIGEGRLGNLMRRLFQSRWGPVLLFTFNLIPFMPGDAISAVAGVIRYPLPKYFLFVTSSTVIKMVFLCLVGRYATGLADRFI